MTRPDFSSPDEQTSGVETRSALLSVKSASFAKRSYDVLFASAGLVLLSPLMLLLAALVKAGDGGPVFYCQWRVGLHGRRFRICKFRTMTPLAEGAGPQVTSDGDPRVTRIGRFLRKTKFDELPQLWNVLKGEMSLVGPRPEVPKYVAHYTVSQRSILNLKPGITARATLCFRDEERLLSQADDVEEFYVKHCLPLKLQLDLEYAARANLLSDTWIIFRTILPWWRRAANRSAGGVRMEQDLGAWPPA
ncbi:MAG TPA: sugar transferase [Verrucomicrobiae bacterium]